MSYTLKERRLWWRGGPLVGSAAGLTILVACLGLDSLVLTDGSIAVFVNPEFPGAALMSCGLAAALGAALSVDTRDRAGGVMSRRSLGNVGLVGGILGVFVAVTTVAVLMNEPKPGNVSMFVLAAESALGVGVVVGLGTSRWPRLTLVIGAAAAGFLVFIAARSALIEAVRVDDLFTDDGFTVEGQRALDFLTTWRPVLMAVVTALTITAVGRLVAHGDRLVWLSLLASAPLVLRIVGFGLGTWSAGTAAFVSVPVRFWLLLVVGCVAGFFLAAVIPPSRHAR